MFGRGLTLTQGKHINEQFQQPLVDPPTVSG